MPRRRRGRPGRRWFFLCAAGLLACAGSELVSRAFWLVRYGLPLTLAHEPTLGLYPELRQLREPEHQPSAASFDLLLLGGSALDPEFGNVAEALHERLRPGKPLRIHNLARAAHTKGSGAEKLANYFVGQIVGTMNQSKTLRGCTLGEQY